MGFFIGFILTTILLGIGLDWFKTRKVDPGYVTMGGKIIHSDEPLWCPLCHKPFYRWDWTQAEKEDPTFREKYYNHVLIESEGVYKLPCTSCAVSKRQFILDTRDAAFKKEQRRWNGLSVAEKRAEFANQPVTSGPSLWIDNKGEIAVWKPGDE